MRTPVPALFALLAAGCSAAASAPPEAPGEDRGWTPPQAPLRLKLERPELPGDAAPAPIIEAMRTQLRRSRDGFKALGDEAPYFLAYQVTDRSEASVVASAGALIGSSEARQRTLDVDVRVGSHELDNTHPLKGAPLRSMMRFERESWILPLDDEPKRLLPTLWLATDRAYKSALQDYLSVKGNAAVKAGGGEEADDFSREEPVVHRQPLASLEIDRAAWEERLRGYSALFADHPQILSSSVSLDVDVVNRFFVSSEGSSIQVSRTYVVLTFQATARTEDGMDLFRHGTIHAASPEALPPEEEVRGRIQEVIDDLLALRRAPLAEPYVGPAILDGRAAGVFFHEVFGHRVEGHRQKDQDEGMTFARQVGERILPDFVDVYDDPTVRRLDGALLRGFYAVDDEGVRAQRAGLVEDGVLRGFLMSRSPTRGFERSNGHGRREEGNAVVARQGNLIVHPERATSPEALKRMLIEEVERQGKPYGLRFAEVAGGFTQTTRFGTQSFRVTPIMVYRVYPDGREELVRGANIDGTPLTALSQIVAAADDVAVFNGTCGAESGWVPVSAASPSLLVSKIEIANKLTEKEKPPILPPPGSRGGGGAR